MIESPAIIVKNVHKQFILPHEQQSSLKGAFVNILRSKKSFEIQKALTDISFEVQKGDFFGIVGRNGSGKSTLLKLLAGIYTPTKGAIHVNGKLTPFIELGVGFNQELTGKENIFLNGALLGFSRKEMIDMYDDIVSFAELEKFMDQKLKNYSSGMQVRLAFSIAIRAQTDILLLDEVLAVGDAAFQQKCFNYFEELKERKQTVVFVSHDMSAVRRFCNRAIYIDQGRMTHIGTPTEIADVYTVKNIEGAKNENKEATVNKNKISTKIVQRIENKVILEVTFKSAAESDVYIGIAVLRDGISVAEITTSPKVKLSAKGKLTYTLDICSFNPGAYQIGAGLFKVQNRELLAATESRNQFAIKGSDETKGGALKLVDTWEYN